MAINLSNFINKAELDYSREEIFKIFKQLAKQDFPRFNEKEAIGTSTHKKIGAYATRSAQAYIEITDYVPNEVYEVTTITSKTGTTFKSRYELKEIGENKTELTLMEEQGGPGVFQSINVIIQKLIFKGRIKKKFEYLTQGLILSIENERKRVNPKYVSSYDEAATTEVNTDSEAKA